MNEIKSKRKMEKTFGITFCSNKKCRLKRCKRHLSNAPKNSEISMAELEGTEYCPEGIGG